MNVSDETAAGVLTLTARPSTIPRRARFDPNMKGSLGSTIGNIRFYHELTRASCLVQKSAKPIGPIQLAFLPGGLIPLAAASNFWGPSRAPRPSNSPYLGR